LVPSLRPLETSSTRAYAGWQVPAIVAREHVPPFRHAHSDGGRVTAPLRLVAWIAGALALAAGGAAVSRSLARDLSTPVDLPRVAYTTSTSCVMCHPKRYETWHRTFHRTMTQ